jgi:hypothetical protein
MFVLFISLTAGIVAFFLFLKSVFGLADEVWDEGASLLIKRGGAEEWVATDYSKQTVGACGAAAVGLPVWDKSSTNVDLAIYRCGDAEIWGKGLCGDQLRDLFVLAETGARFFDSLARIRNWPTTSTIARNKNIGSMHNPAHPGEVLREYLPEGLAVAEAAKRSPKVRRLSVTVKGCRLLRKTDGHENCGRQIARVQEREYEGSAAIRSRRLSMNSRALIRCLMATGLVVCGTMRAAESNKACGLLTPSELQSVLGVEVVLGGGVAMPAGGAAMCIGKTGTATVMLRVAKRKMPEGKAPAGARERAGIEMAKKMGAQVDVKNFGPITCSTMVPAPSMAQYGYNTTCTVVKAGVVAGVEVTVKRQKDMIPIERLRPLAEKMSGRI